MHIPQHPERTCNLWSRHIQNNTCHLSTANCGEDCNSRFLSTMNLRTYKTPFNVFTLCVVLVRRLMCYTLKYALQKSMHHMVIEITLQSCSNRHTDRHNIENFACDLLGFPKSPIWTSPSIGTSGVTLCEALLVSPQVFRNEEIEHWHSNLCLYASVYRKQN